MQQRGLKKAGSKDVLSWTVSYHGSSGQQAVPQQQDGVACGGYMLNFVEAGLRTGSTRPSDWVPSALISQHGYEGYKQYLHAKITTSSNYQAAGQFSSPGTQAPARQPNAAGNTAEADSTQIHCQQAKNNTDQTPSAASPVQFAAAVMPTSANNTQKRTPHSRRNATPAEIRHAQGGLITAAELHLFDELLPEFSSGSDKVDFLGLMNKWNSERATTTQQLQAMQPEDRDTAIRQIDVADLKAHYNKLQRERRYQEAQTLIQQRPVFHNVFANPNNPQMLQPTVQAECMPWVSLSLPSPPSAPGQSHQSANSVASSSTMPGINGSRCWLRKQLARGSETPRQLLQLSKQKSLG